MSITKLSLKNFTVFEEAEFELAPGINVLIGENGTGKTHVLKALYAATKVLPDGLPNRVALDGFAWVFGYTSVDGTHLARRRSSGQEAELAVTKGDQTVRLNLRDTVNTSQGSIETPSRPVFIPSREILSVFPGFAEANRNRELAFDATYLDLADALALTPLKGDALAKQQPLIDLVEEALGGREEEKGGAFYVTLDGDRFEAQLVAEGLRKVAQVARLIRNGRIAPGTLLLWDEPEANLNPVLLRKVTDVLVALARAGVQIVLATHDYLLSQTLSLLAEHPREGAPSMRFFSLARGPEGAVRVTAADTLVGIEDNPILREHANQYDLEVEAFQGDA